MGREERGEAMMTKEQIIAGIIDCLDHQLCSAMGHMQDKYYKGEFFHLFAEAYNHGFMADKSLTGSSLWDIIGERWIPPDMEKETTQIKLLYELLNCWHEWQYAWDHCHKKKF
jgi:hypothetical protein